MAQLQCTEPELQIALAAIKAARQKPARPAPQRLTSEQKGRELANEVFAVAKQAKATADAYYDVYARMSGVHQRRP